jgi:hypothetical protein
MYLPEYTRHKKNIVGGKYRVFHEIFLCRVPPKNTGEDAFSRVSNWRHPTNKGVVLLLAAVRKTRHVAVFFAECLVVALGKDPFRLVFLLTESISHIVSCSYSSPGANT